MRGVEMRSYKLAACKVTIKGDLPLLLLLLLLLWLLPLLLQDGSQAQRVHPLRHVPLVVCGEVVSPHVVVLRLERELLQHAVLLWVHRAHLVRRQQDGACNFILIGT